MKKLILPFILFIFLSSCKKDELNKDAFAPGSNQSINNWIYDNMEFYYYWANELPSKEGLEKEPESFFYDLLSDSDRFSWIQSDFDELLNSLRGVTKEAGYEFILYRDQNSENNVIGQISYIKKNSPAAKLDLKRGDIFDKINGTTLTIDNYQSLLTETFEDHNLNLKRYNANSDTFEDKGNINLKNEVVSENPILLDSIYEIGSNRIGYLVYNLFSVGPNETSEAYLTEMDNVFNSFKSNGINQLILDLRYNSGGAETATINLASLIGSNITSSNVFVKRKYNSTFEAALIDRYGAEILNKNFLDKPENIGSQLVNNQLVVLTSSRTASASELLINGLKPYMNVFLIGDQTVGKNVGSITIYDEDDQENNYGLQPIVTKSFNELDMSEYENGFNPDISLLDNSLIKKALGDTQEIMLSTALDYLTNASKSYNLNRNRNYKGMAFLISSKETKRNYGIYNIDAVEGDLY